MQIRKRLIGKQLAGITVLAAGLTACGGANDAKIKPENSEIMAINSTFDPRIGEAFNQYTDQYMAQSCISLDPANLEYIPPQFGELVVTRNSSFEQLKDSLSGGGELNLNLSAFQANGSLQFANEMQSSSYSTNYMISLNVKGGELAIPQQFTAAQVRPSLNALGTLAKGAPNEDGRVSKCGTRFVTRKSLSANVVAVLKFEFANKGQKDSFAGKVALNISQISGNAELKAALDKASEDANITLKVVQMGGDASQLSKALSKEITKCNSQDRASCVTAIEKLTEYVRDEFPKQFETSEGKVDPNRFVATKYEYGSYESVDENWIPPQLSPEKAKQLNVERGLVGEKMLDEEANYFRANSLARSGIKMTPQQLEEIRGIQTIIVDRLKVYADAAQICYQSANWTLCNTALTKIDSLLKADPTKYLYDVTKLVIVPNDIGGWCAKIKQWGTVMKNAEGGDAVASTILSDDELFSLYHVTKKIFADPTTPANSKEIQFNVNGTKAANQIEITKELSCWDVKQNVRDVKMSSVDLTAARLANVDPLASLYYTSNLNLSANFVEDASALSKIRYLTTLNLAQNRVTTLAGINNTNIESLNLTNNGLKKGERSSADSIFREISGSQTLKTLTLDSNPALRSMASLSNMPALTTLSLVDTNVDQDELLAIQKRRAIDFKSLQSIAVRATNVTTPTKSCVALTAEIPGLSCR